MSELVSQIAQRTGISEDKARQAAEVAINFFKSKLPGVGGQLDGVLHGGASGTGARRRRSAGRPRRSLRKKVRVKFHAFSGRVMQNGWPSAASK